MDSLFILDFDGVVCDSLPECYVSSWIAHFQYYNDRAPDITSENVTLASLAAFFPAAVGVAELGAFKRLRPFIRQGEDYLVLQDLLHDETSRKINSQEEFDVYVTAIGTDKMQAYRSMFYQVRDLLLRTELQFWLGLNRLFFPSGGILADLGGDPGCYILSTKKAAFIRRILEYNQVPWPEERIICSGSRDKGGIISALIDTRHAEKAYYFEDQIDHLRKVEDARIKTFLADWGYVKEEWRSDSRIAVMGKEEFRRFVLNYFLQEETGTPPRIS